MKPQRWSPCQTITFVAAVCAAAWAGIAITIMEIANG